MAITAAQYQSMRLAFRIMLSVEGVGPTDSDVLSFSSQLFADSSGAAALSTARNFLATEVLRTVLSAAIAPTDSNVSDFLTQLATDSGGATPMGPTKRYRSMRNALRAAMSGGGLNPSDADVLSYFAPYGIAFVAPILAFEGQSNTGGRDLVFTDPKTGLPFVPNANIIYRDDTGANNPQAVRTYPYKSNHGLELSIGNDLSTAQGPANPVYQVKAWHDGTDLQSWLSAGANYPQLAHLVSVAQVASPLRQVAWIQQRGENEVEGISGSPTTYQADLATFFALVRSLFGAEYSVRFYVIAVNPNIPVTTNLAIVRAAQSAACLADGNAVYVTDFDSLIPAADGGLHYASGQTFGMGSTLASRIIADYANGLGASGIGAGTDLTPADIFGSSNILRYVDTRLAATSTTLTDQGTLGNSYTGTGMVVTASDATLANVKTVQVPTTTTLASALILPQAGTTPTCEILVMKLLTSTGGQQIILSPGANFELLVEFLGASGDILQDVNGALAGPPFGSTEGTGVWQLTRSDFSNQATDYHAAGRFMQQANAGNNAATGLARTMNGFGAPGNFQLLLGLTLNIIPTPSQWNRLRALLTRQLSAGYSKRLIAGL